MRTIQQPEQELESFILACTSRLEADFLSLIDGIPAADLKAALKYTLLNGGKRLRPLLVYAAGTCFAAPEENLRIAACAVEMMHTYSLIHDDLPCMDNADLRRGKPTCHREFNEGLAVLTGDGLQTLAMETIATRTAPLSADRRLMMIAALSNACGPSGMVAGQALDISMLQDPNLSESLLLEIYRLKTGVLFTTCLELGWLASNDENERHLQSLRHFGDCLGLAFQIQDDILDIVATSDQLGKTQGQDSKNNKVTYPERFGLSEAKDKVDFLYDEALSTINYMGNKAFLLRALARRMLSREK